jgi:hypothetical protein
MTTILIVLVFLTQHDHWIRSVIQIVETLRATKKKNEIFQNKKKGKT